MAMEVFSCCEVNLLCAAILVFIGYKVRTGLDQRNSQRRFCRLLTASLIFVLADAVCRLAYHGYLTLCSPAGYLMNALCFIMSGTAAYLWYLYFASLRQSPRLQSTRGRVLCAIPLMLFGTLIIINYWTGWLFTVSDTGGYEQQPLMAVQIVLGYGYVAAAFVQALHDYVRKEPPVDRERCWFVALISLVMLAFGMAQGLMVGRPILCAGITLALLMMYTDSMEQAVSIDPLTQMNNRRQLVRYLTMKAKNPGRAGQLYVLMLDVDDFKHINDYYGHVEGDRALVHTAAAIKSVCGRFGCFAARYGGDEFILVCDGFDDDVIQRVTQCIHEALASAAHQAQLPYPLTASIGVHRYEPGKDSLRELIEMADRSLYETKRGVHP